MHYDYQDSQGNSLPWSVEMRNYVQASNVFYVPTSTPELSKESAA